VLLDADLGGANLHTFFGVTKPRTTLTEFFDEKIPLEALIVDSGIQNLGLLVGAVGPLAMDSIKYRIVPFNGWLKNNCNYVRTIP